MGATTIKNYFRTIVVVGVYMPNVKAPNNPSTKLCSMVTV